jgi:hypothetical protein
VAERDELVTELAVLTAAGGRTLSGSIPLPPNVAEHLEPLAARAVSLLARYDRTVNAVQAGDDRETLQAMSVFHDAAAAQNRKVLWCAPTAELVERARDAQVADAVATVDDVHDSFRKDSVSKMPAGFPGGR